jgi:hypothetical protein
MEIGLKTTNPVADSQEMLLVCRHNLNSARLKN